MIKPNFLQLSIFFTPLLTLTAYAKQIGELAKGLHSTTNWGAQVIHVILILLGIGLITAGLIRFRERRNNPEEATWGTIIGLIVFGLALIAVAFIPMPK